MTTTYGIQANVGSTVKNRTRMAIGKATQRMKNTRTVTVLFKFIGAAENGKILMYTSKLQQEFSADMPNRRFAQDQYGDSLQVLTDEQIDQFLQENIDTHSRSDVENMFTFWLDRGQCGHVYLTQEPDSIGTTEEMVNRNYTVVAQMVRFGFLNKAKPRK